MEEDGDNVEAPCLLVETFKKYTRKYQTIIKIRKRYIHLKLKRKKLLVEDA